VNRKRTKRAPYIRHDDHDHPKTSWWYKKCRAYMQEHDGEPRVATEEEWAAHRESGTPEMTPKDQPPVPNKATLETLTEGEPEAEPDEEPEEETEPDEEETEEEEPDHKDPVVTVPPGSIGVSALRALIQALEGIEEYVDGAGDLELATLALTIEDVPVKAQFSAETGWSVMLRG